MTVSVNYLHEIIARINQETSANAEFVRFIPCANVRVKGGEIYTIVYKSKYKKFSVSKRVNIGYLSEVELFEMLNQ